MFGTRMIVGLLTAERLIRGSATGGDRRVPSRGMEHFPSQPSFHCLDEAFKGCVRIRLFECEKQDAQTSYALEVVAWNTWAGQPKLILHAGGLSLSAARQGFKAAKQDIEDYSWTTGELVFAGAV
jgi:hypothetical protein